MSGIILDRMNNASEWSSFEPDGATTSSELVMTNDPSSVRYGKGGSSGLVTASEDAFNHMLVRSLADIDLGYFDRLYFSILGNRPANGSSTNPFYLEVRMASASMGLPDPGNTWKRYINLSAAGTWETTRLSLDDLPDEIRSGVNLLQLRVVESSRAFMINIDEILAVRDEFLADTDSEIKNLLHNKYSIESGPVPCIINVAGNTLPDEKPYILVSNYNISYSDSRTNSSNSRGDFVFNGYRLQPETFAYDIYYSVEVFTDQRINQASIFEFVLETMPPRGILVINTNPVPYEMVMPPVWDNPDIYNGRGPVLHYKVSSRQETGSHKVVKPAENISISVESMGE